MQFKQTTNSWKYKNANLNNKRAICHQAERDLKPTLNYKFF